MAVQSIAWGGGLLAADQVVAGWRGEVVPVSGLWPVVPPSIRATIAFTAGYEDDTRPPALVHAVRLLLGSFYAQRESVVTGVSVIEAPLAYRFLIDKHRRVTL